MRFNLIAIEREYASGGHEIGERLAKKLGIPCYGQEILEKAADRVGMSLGELSRLEESMTGSLLFSLNMLANFTSGRGMDLTWAQKLALAEADIVRELSTHPCVIVGRGAAGLLAEKDRALKVFIHADYDTRIKRAVEIYRVDQSQAESVLRRQDRRRANYFKTITGLEWKGENAYHMMLNSGKLGIAAAAELIYSAVE